MEGIIQSKSKTFITFCFCFLFGVVVASVLDIQLYSRNIFYIAVCILLTMTVGVSSNRKGLYIMLCISCIFLGMTRYTFAFPVQEIHSGKKTVEGYVSAEPDVRIDGVRYIVKTNIGDVYVKSELYPRFRYGDRLKMTCQIEKPEPIESFRYDMYLARYGVFAICQRAIITQTGEGKGNILYGNILAIKESIARKINMLWHEPNASFMAGLLYGYRGGLGSLNELFSRTGVTHIIAISGYNITIISSILMSFCLAICIPRKQAFYIITIGIAVFVTFAGLSASVVRAGVMGIIVLLATQIGRTTNVFNVLLLTAVVMTLHNPIILMWDAGFQLSFISTLGLVYLAPIIEPFFQKIPNTFGMQESVVSTLAAILATLPLILYQFGRLSIVAPVVNLLILWIIPTIMLIGVVAVFLSYFFSPLAQLISWFAWVGLLYIIKVVEWFANIPWASVDIIIPVWAMILLYILIILLIRKKQML